VAPSGDYAVTLNLAPHPLAANAHLAFRGVAREKPIAAGATECIFEHVPLEPGDGKLEAWLSHDDARDGVLSVDVSRRD
jgi:hypothetical protein